MEDFHIPPVKATMALPDPIPTLTVDAITYDFARTSFGDAQSIYRTANGLDVLTIAKTEKARSRFSVRFDRSKIAADPFDDNRNVPLSMSSYLVMDVPPTGFTAAEIQDHTELLTAFLVAGTPDYVLRVIQGEI